MTNPRIPSFRPNVGASELDAVRAVFESRWLGMGPMAHRFETLLAQRLDARHVIAVDRGTSALHLALDVLDLLPGDEVIVPSLTFAASVQAILAARATPVFCEVEPESLTMNIDDALSRITPRTRAVMPVHYAGLACDMAPLLTECRRRNIVVVEDAAHAFGSSYRGRPIGSFGDLTCFSFDAIKNITCGEGGAVATGRDDWAQKLRLRRNIGIDSERWRSASQSRPWHYQVVSHGYRYHMSDINAAIGIAQLERMEQFRQRKCEVVRRYDQALADLPGIVPVRRDLDQTFPFAYVVRVTGGQRDALHQHLRAAGIDTMVQFIPNHLQPAFAQFRRPLPVTEQLYGEVLSLPLFTEMTDEEVERVIGQVRSFFAADRAAESVASASIAAEQG